ncbi:hypothetical protein A9G11_05880 [Gilliamella sp. wkB108]|uniref:hypothetical protein n=1 Tax=Gilliamella sp. wkB108 TaxID=3120256 RepID=UPI00080E53DA|nr:hypothetical protein [Gilliamella apicola]OCG23488.1 hypothetical protein A9G11_05880 [Gilliamella apicola]
MNIEQKLKQSQCCDSIYFFREGVFAQLFGVSLYLAITELKLGVKVCGYRYKKLDNLMVLRAGLPILVLEKRYATQLLKQSYGYEIKGNWQVDLANYKAWYTTQLNELLQAEQIMNSTNKVTCKKTRQITFPEKGLDENLNLPLSE